MSILTSFCNGSLDLPISNIVIYFRVNLQMAVSLWPKKKIKITNRKKITVQSDFYPSRKTSTTALRPSDTWKHRAFRITGKLHFFYHNRIRRFYNEKSIKKKKNV